MLTGKFLLSGIARFLQNARGATALAVCVVLCAAAAFAAQLRICGRCGVEALENEAVCRECGAQLPAIVVEAAPVPETPAALKPVTGEMRPALDSLLRILADDVRTVRALEQTQPALAFHYYRQCIGLVRAVPPEQLAQDVRDSLVAGLARCRQAISRGERICGMCNGTGKRTLPNKQTTTTGPRGLSSTTATASVALECDRCRGQGRSIAPRTMEELRVVIGQGRTTFERQMHALGRVSCGRGFLPVGLEEQFTLQERAMIRGGLADGCVDCMGLGKTDCNTCKGFGTVPCKARGCENGRVAGVNDAPSTLCTSCHGAGELACVPCQGNGTLSCRACKGSGQGVRCKTCGGEGIATCTACRGKGGDCKACGGEIRILCAACFGEGVKGR